MKPTPEQIKTEIESPPACPPAGLPACESTTEPRVSIPAAAVAWLFVQAVAAWSWLAWRCTSISICAWCQKVTRWPWLPWSLLKHTGYQRTHGICRACYRDQLP